MSRAKLGKLIQEQHPAVGKGDLARVRPVTTAHQPGYWLMVLSTPFRGRSLACSLIVYSSRTIGEQRTSRNQEHFRCFEEVKRLLGE